MKIDHLAFRVENKEKTANFFIECFGYRIDEDLPEGFDITFEDGSMAKCLVLLPPEKVSKKLPFKTFMTDIDTGIGQEYHLAPEIFISQGSPGSVVDEWVKKRKACGGSFHHHTAYQVDSVEQTMKEWQEKGYAEFTTEKPLTCPGLTQVFTKPSELTGIIYEFIERETNGFCKDNVKDLMNSTKGL